MCDTMVSTPQSSAEGMMIVGKNSDREPNEAQNITFVPASDHAAGGKVRCTYIEIPQIRHTYAALLSRPFWMFGAEMGVNEHGVVIGNEAVFTKIKYHKENDSLLGMDMLRLALERSRNATDAIDVITQCISTYGQGGVHTMGGTKYYHNSFIIADPQEAYILETAGEHWVYRKVPDIATISNCLTIEDDYDKSSQEKEKPGSTQRDSDLWRSLNFTRNFSDSVYTYFARGRIRKTCSFDMLSKKKGMLTSSDMMEILRNHNVREPYQPGYRPMERICLHAGGLISTQTVGSMVAVLKKGRAPLIYFTGTAAPCMSIFKPHVIGKNQKKYYGVQSSNESQFGGFDIYGSSTNRFNEKNLWWIGEGVHRRVLMNYEGLMPIVDSQRNMVEKRIIQEIEKKWKNKNEHELYRLCGVYTKELLQLQSLIHEIVKKEFSKMKCEKKVSWFYAFQWNKINVKAGLRICN